MPADAISPFQDQPRAPYPTRTDIIKNNPETKQSPQSEGSSIGFSFQNSKKMCFKFCFSELKYALNLL